MTAAKPSHLKAVQGTERADRKNDREPKPDVGDPVCPDDLSTDGKVMWGALCVDLRRMGVLTVVDGHALRMLVEKTLEVRAMRRKIDLDGYFVVVTTTQKEQVMKPHPLLDPLHRAETELRLQQQRFGMDPSARTKVHTVAPPPKVNDKPSQAAPVRAASSYFTGR